MVKKIHPEMNAAIYARYSSSEQAGTLTIESQVRACKEYALSNGMRLVETYVDRGISGSRDQSRPEFQEMIARARTKPRPFDVILVWKFSRFFRDRYKSAIYKSLLRQHGINVVSVTEPVEKDTPGGVLMEGMIEVIDQFYSARLSEETRRGLKENVLAGYRGGSVAPYGYQRKRVEGPAGKPKTIIVPNSEQAPIARRIFEEYAGGQAGLKKIAYRLNEEAIPSARGGTWDPSSIRSILKNEVYLGWGVLGKRRYFLGPEDRVSVAKPPRSEWIVNEKAHEPIIERRVWDAVQKQFERARCSQLGGRAKSRARYLLAGLLKCGNCGGNYLTYKTRKRDGSWWYGYACGIRKRRGRAACDNMLEVPHDPFNRRIVESIVKLIGEGNLLDNVATEMSDKVRKISTESQSKIRAARRELRSVERRLDLCVDAVLNGEFRQIKDKMTRLEVRREVLEKELAQLEASANHEQIEFTKEQIQAAQEAIVAELNQADQDALRPALAEIFDHIKIYPSGKLVFNFKPEGLFPSSATLQHGWYTASYFTHVAELRAVLGRYAAI